MRACSLGRPSQRALAPEATISVRVWISPAEVWSLMGCASEVDRVEMGQLERRAEAGGLLLHVLDQLGALDAFGPAGKVLDQRGDGELAAGLVAFEHERVEAGAAGVNGGGESGAAGAENDGIANLSHRVSCVDCSSPRRTDSRAALATAAM